VRVPQIMDADSGKLRVFLLERRDTDVLEIVIGQPAQQLALGVVGAEHLGILGETDPAEPNVDVQVQSLDPRQRQFLKIVESSRPL
jgi:hypothetical protein